MISALSKLSQRQPIQQLAFHKEQWEINGVPFECHESYYQGELLNGVDLRVKSVKGLHNRNDTYDYLQDSQEVVFAASAHLMVYNTHKRTYHQLFPLEGQVHLLRTHLEKMNSREYILWVQSFPCQQETAKTPKKRNKKHSRICKRTASSAPKVQPNESKALLKNLFGITAGDIQPGGKGLLGQGGTLADTWYMLKVYDYTRKEFVYEGTLQLEGGRTLQDIFIIYNHYKLVGYITEDYQSDLQYIHYYNLAAREKPVQGGIFALEGQPVFASLSTSKKLEGLLFNSQLNNMVFFHAGSLNVIELREESEQGEQQILKQFLLMGSKHNQEQEKPKGLLLHVEEKFQLQEYILSLALNDQYLAVLTASAIRFYSAFDLSSLIFTHPLSGVPPEPLNIEFNKSSVMVTHKNSRSIFTYALKNKTLKLISQTVLQLTHCKEILRVFTNSISSQIFCVVLFYELQTKDQGSTFGPTIGSHLLQGLVDYVMKPSFVDIAAAFLSAGGAEASLLGLSKRRFLRVHVCPWLSAYVLETEEAVELGGWRETFQNKKCMSLHPTGLFLVVCLKEAFRLYLVTREGFVNSYRGDSVKDIQACAISPAGNHLVVCSPNVVLVYDFYSCMRLRTISLPFGTMIEGVEFSGHTLVCYLRSRKIYLYDSLNQYKETFCFNPKGVGQGVRDEEGLGTVVGLVSEIANLVSCSPVYYCPLLNFFIFSQRNMVVFYNCTTQTVHASVQLQPLSCIYYCSNLATLFLGTEAGDLICFAWPNKPHNLLNEQRKFKLHTGRVMDIRVSSDLRQMITVGEDESLCVCSLVLVQNLKRFQGLELVEQLASGIRICYDFLGRRGLCQFTHSKLQDKNDSLKDHEDQVLNANFILPEERQKQKEQMFTNVKTNMKQIADGNSHEYDAITNSTTIAREQVAKARRELTDLTSSHQQEKQKIKQAMYAEYIRHYSTTEASRKELQETTIRLQSQLQNERNKLKGEAVKAQKESERSYLALAEDKEREMRQWKGEERAQLGEIDVEKQQFIAANVGSLQEVIGQLNNNNGVLACKNNNLEKQMSDLRRKMQEHQYLLYRLQTNTTKLWEDQVHYEGLKADNKRLVEKEDRINLTEIEKRYVKQTQTLIQRDKEINVQLVNHHKEKEILIHLQKCLQGVEESIQTLVANILQQKKDRQQEIQRIQATRQQAQSLMSDMLAKKKDKISMRNQFNNYLCRLQAIVEDVMHARTKPHVQQLLLERELIDKTALDQPKTHLQDKQALTKILSQKVQTLGGDAKPTRSKLSLLRSSRGDRSLRVLKTEANQRITNTSYGQRQLLSTTTREAIGRREKEVYMKLDAEQKQYERIKTEQLVFENTRKKFNLENQDLIQNYNSLAIENKRIVHALRRQESLTRAPMRREKSLRADASPTPFQLYLANKDSYKSQKAFVPIKTYQQP